MIIIQRNIMKKGNIPQTFSQINPGFHYPDCPGSWATSGQQALVLVKLSLHYPGISESRLASKYFSYYYNCIIID